jgi:hypothetical protein
MQRYNKELRVQLAQRFSYGQKISIDYSTHAMHVCVKTFPKRYDFHSYDKKQPDFLDKRENQ